jgi:chemotaxis protein MotA
VLLSKPQHKVLQLIRELPSIIKGQPAEFRVLAEFKQLLRCAHLYRLSQVRVLEQEIKLAQQPVLIKGVQLILDRCSLEDVNNIMRKERARLLLPNQEKAQILRLMSSYAPAFGMLGTLLGMIHMLYGLGEVGLEQVGTTMGFSLLTTLYGLVVANLVCKPLAIKLEKRTAEHAAHLNTLLEGLSMIYEKTHPMVIRDMLEAHGIPTAHTPISKKKAKSRFTKLLPLAASHVD